MQIYGTSQLHGAQPINAPHAQRAADVQGSATRSGRQSRHFAGRRFGQPVERDPRHSPGPGSALKAAIAGGTYETADKLGGPLDRLLDEIG